MMFVAALLAFTFQTPAQSAPAAALADLVPKNTVVFVQAPSLERAAKLVERLQGAFAPQPGLKLDVARLLALIELPGDANAVDPARPVGICLELEEGAGSPLPAFLIPVRDADAFLKSIQKPGSPMMGVAKGGYACIGMGAPPELPSAPSAIARGLPEGEISARIDLGRLVKQFGEQIDQGLDAVETQMDAAATAQAGGFDTTPIMSAYMDGVRDLVDSVETLDVAVRLSGDELELGFTLANAEGSALASFGSKEKTGVRSLAGLLDSDSSFCGLMGMDMAALMKRFQPLLDTLPDAYPEALRPMMKQIFGHVGELYGLMGTAQIVSVDFGPDGLRYCAYMQSQDPAKLVGVYRGMMKSMPGFGVEELPEREVDGAKVTSFRMKLDLAEFTKQLDGKTPSDAELTKMDEMMKHMFGPDGMTFRIATKNGTTALVMGGGDDFLHATLARMSSKHEAPAFVARALAQVGDLNPCFVMRYDLGRMMDGLKGIMASVAPGELALLPAMQLSISAWGGVDGRVWRGAMSSSLTELAALTRMKK